LHKEQRKGITCVSSTSGGSFGFVLRSPLLFFARDKQVSALARAGSRASASKAPRYSRSIYRAATAALVEKQSSEMLELINEARSEYMLQESLYLDEGDGYAQEAPPPPYPSRAPPPQPPTLAKYHIYNDPLEFADMDQIAISVSPPIPRDAFFGIGFPLRVISLSLKQDFACVPRYGIIFRAMCFVMHYSHLVPSRFIPYLGSYELAFYSNVTRVRG